MFRRLLGLGKFGRCRRTAWMVCGGMMTLSALAAAAHGEANLVTNGGFEDGPAGWMWEQWENKPLPGIVDKSDAREGDASFKMGLSGATGGRYLAKEIKLDGTPRDYVLSIQLKGAGVPNNGFHMRVGIDGRGLLGAASGSTEVIQVGGNFDWRKFEIPVPAGAVGEAPKLTLFIHHDQIGTGVVWIDGITLLPAGAAEPAASAAPAPQAVKAEPEDNAGNLFDNGGFEAGEQGWQWEQWENKPLPGKIDKADRTRGAASFRMGLKGATGGRYLAKEIQFPEPNKDYLLTFWLKADDLPVDAAYVRLGLEGKGWMGSADGKSDLVRIGGTAGWKQYAFPVTGVGDCPKATLFIYHDQVDKGTLGIDAVALKVATDKDLQSAAAVGKGPALFGETSNPDISTFAAGQPVELTFRATGLKDQATKLQLEIVDEHDQLIRKQDVALKIEQGSAEAVVLAPNEKLGFYRVKATLSDGTLLKALGTRKAGFITYAVVPDPAQRKNYGEIDTRFGMQGGFGPWGDESLMLLGARWVLDGSYEWRRNEPERAGQMAEAIAAGKFRGPKEDSGWKTFSLPTLMASPEWAVVPGTCPYMTGVLTPAGEKAWADYCRLAVQQYAERNPDRQERIYQITWEPVFPWGFKGTNEDLIRIYEIAYKAIHEADPKAVVAGPCNGVRAHEIDVQAKQMQLGLGKHMDMFSAHPYYPIDAEKAGMPSELRRMKKAIDDHSANKNMPMIGTEQGFSTEEDLDKELTQARGLLRQNLIVLGEGWRFNMAFYITDYRMGEQKGHGYYYNLDDRVPWGTAKISPRPIVPAYAAQSLLLDGSKSLGAIEWLGSTVWGYVFEREGRVTLAIWDFGDEKREISLPVGARKVQVYDWMGNVQDKECPAGTATVTVGPEPIYITGVSANIWGPTERRMLTLDDAAPKVYPGTSTKITGKIRATDTPFRGEIVLQGEGLKRMTQPATVAAGQTASFSFDLAIPATANPIITPMTVMLVSDEVQTSAAGARLQIASPLEILAVMPTFDKGQPGVAVTVKDDQGQGFQGLLDLELAGIATSKQQLKLSLSPGETRRVVAMYPSLNVPSSKVSQLKTTVTAANGSTVTHSSGINFLAAVPVPTAAKLDGNLEEWSAFPATHLAGKEIVIRSPEYFRDDLSADIRYGWDDKALYVVAEVNDEVHHNPETGVTNWRGDCLQLAFNLDPRSREVMTGNVLDTNVRRAMEINVALTKTGVEAFRSVTFDSVTWPQGLLTAEQVKAVVTRAEGKTRYEVAIPWKSIGADAAPKSGDLIGIAASVNDEDSDDQKDPTGLGLFGGIAPQKEPDKFGLLVLTGK